MSVTGATDTSERTAAEFVDWFADLWAHGATDPQRFFARLESRTTAETRFVQPLAPTVRGLDGLRGQFLPLFEVIPDLRSEVHRWGETDDGLFIEHTLSGTLAGKRLRWTAVDRFIFGDDGRLAERRAYFDPLPLVVAMLTRPWASVKLLPPLLRRKERT